MRSLLVNSLVLALSACGSDGSGSGLDSSIAVDDLTVAEQTDLCESFLDAVCPVLGDEFCDECVMTACERAATDANISDECAAEVTVGDVDACSNDVDFEVCTSTMGGCMFDALEAACR